MNKILVAAIVFLAVLLFAYKRKSLDYFGASLSGGAGSPAGRAGSTCQTNDDCLSGQCEGSAIIPGENPQWASLGPINNTGYGTCD